MGSCCLIFVAPNDNVTTCFVFLLMLGFIKG
jgi:hypothetical protein